MDTTPVSLLRRLQQQGDADDWQRFVQLLTPLLHAWSRRAGANGQDGDDLVQDTLIALYQGLPDFRHEGRGSFRRWLHVILRNKWRDRLRRVRPQPLGDDVQPEEPDGAAELGEEEFRLHVASRALRLLQQDYEPTTWQGFWETVVRGRPTAEVARELGITPNAIYLARGRLLARLRAELADLLD